MNELDRLRLLKPYAHPGFRLVPLKPTSKILLLRWKDYQLSNEDFRHFLSQDIDSAFACDDSFHAASTGIMVCILSKDRGEGVTGGD